MNDPKPDSDERWSALFAQMVVQQANMALMLLGKTPHPQSGQTILDLDAARLFIDELEMLQVKTKGNLSREEENLLKQSLMSLQLAFVEAVESPAPKPGDHPQEPGAPNRPGESAAATPEPGAPAATPDTESKKKFTKKY